MSEHTPGDRKLLDRAARYLPGANTGNMHLGPEHPLILREAKGSRVWDIDGNEYIDYLMGSGPMVLGHAHPAVVTAVVEAVEKGSTFFATSEKAVLLAEEIVKAVPCAQKVRFTTSGTDACFQCLRVARSFRKRDKILKFEGGYHGTSDYAVMSVTPAHSALRDFPAAVPGSPGVPRAVGETVLVAPYNDIEVATSIIDEHHDELAAVIIEPAQRILTPVPGFLQAVREATAHHHIPLIFDEVVTGFRLAYGGAQEYYGVLPDLVALGKIVGGGYPLAVIAGTEEIMSLYDSTQTDPDSFVSQIGTLNGNPVACAAGLATLEELRKEGSYLNLHSTGRQLKDALRQLCREAELPVQVSGEDPIFGFYFTDQPISDYRSTLMANTAMMAEFNSLLLEQGILKSWPDKFYPSLAHTSEDLDRTIQIFASAIDRLKG